MSKTNPEPLQTNPEPLQTLYDYLRSCQKVGLQAGIKHGEVSVEVCTEDDVIRSDCTGDAICKDGAKKTALKIVEKMFVWRKFSSGDTQKGDNNYLTFYHKTQCLALKEMSVVLQPVEDSDHLPGSSIFERVPLLDGSNNDEVTLKNQNDDYIAMHDYKLVSGSFDTLKEQNANLLITIFYSQIKEKRFNIALYFQSKDGSVKSNCYLVPKESEITIEKVQINDDDHEKVMHLDHLHFSTTFINPGGDTGGDTG